MSEFRKQLEQGRREHLEVRYPGDLAADVLNVRPMRLGYATKQRKHWLFWANVGALGAVAATVAVVMWRVQPAQVVVKPSEQPTKYVALAPRADEDFSVVPELAGATLVPRVESVVPSVETAATVPAMPSFPSLSDVMKEAGTDTGTTSGSGNSNS